MRSRLGGLLFFAYIVIGLLVAGDVIGNEGNYFSNLSSVEDVVNLVLAVLLWPLLLLGVDFTIGNGGDSGGGGGDSGGGGESGGSSGGK